MNKEIYYYWTHLESLEAIFLNDGVLKNHPMVEKSQKLVFPKIVGKIHQKQ